MAKILVANIPVWHGGLVGYFQSLSIRDKAIIIGEEIARGIGGEAIDERRIPDTEGIRVAKIHMLHRVILLTLKNIEKIIGKNGDAEILATDDEVTRRVVEKIFPGVTITWLPIFSKADPKNKKPTPSFDEESASEPDHRWMKLAETEARKSPLEDMLSGAVLVSESCELIGKTGIRHLPTEFEPFLKEDHRLSIIHPTIILVALSGRSGKPILGSILYSTDFPCTNCAKALAIAGVKKVVVMSGEKPRSAEILRGYGIKIIRLIPPKPPIQT